MAAPASAAGGLITDRSQLIEAFAEGCKPETDFRIGTEHEKFVYRLSDHQPVGYEGPGGIGELLTELGRTYGWSPVYEDGKVIALNRAEGGSVSLEPGGQIELSGAPLKTVHQTCAETNTHLAELKEVCRTHGVGLLGMGFHPTAKRENIHWMPKGRYKIMREHMPRVGSLGLDMMLRTCTIQVNLDFASEADMIKKMRVSLALQPLATVLFANSPFFEGKPNNFISYRAHIWTDTDPHRTGDMPFVFEDGFGFERYADYMLDVPMYFVYRDGRYIDAAGQSFRDFLEGRLPALPGEKPTTTDWEDHITTAFPEVRLKRFIEMRGADGGRWDKICALPALWVGLLYDQSALDAAWDLVKDWTAEDRAQLRADVARQGFKARVGGRTVLEIAREVLALSREGLKRRNKRDNWGDDETQYLRRLQQIVDDGQTMSEEKLLKFEQDWGGDADPVFKAYAY